MSECSIPLSDRVWAGAEVKHVFGTATGTGGADQTLDMPIAIARLDIDPAGWFVGRQQDGRLLAPAFPPSWRSMFSRDRAGSFSDTVHEKSPPFSRRASLGIEH